MEQRPDMYRLCWMNHRGYISPEQVPCILLSQSHFLRPEPGQKCSCIHQQHPHLDKGTYWQQKLSAAIGDDNWGGLVSLYLLGLHSHVRRDVILHASTRQARVTPQVVLVIQMLQGIPSQSVSPVQRLAVLGCIEQGAPLGLLRVGGKISLHVVFSEGVARSGNSIRAGAAETRQRRWAGCVFVIVVRTQHFNAIRMMEAFRRNVNTGGTGATAHHARHCKLRVMGQCGGEACAMSFGEAWDIQKRLVMMQTALLFFDHLLCGADQGLHLAGLSRACLELISRVTITWIAGGTSTFRWAHYTIFIPVASTCKIKEWVHNI